MYVFLDFKRLPGQTMKNSLAFLLIAGPFFFSQPQGAAPRSEGKKRLLPFHQKQDTARNGIPKPLFSPAFAMAAGQARLSNIESTADRSIVGKTFLHTRDFNYKLEDAIISAVSGQTIIIDFGTLPLGQDIEEFTIPSLRTKRINIDFSSGGGYDLNGHHIILNQGEIICTGGFDDFTPSVIIWPRMSAPAIGGKGLFTWVSPEFSFNISPVHFMKYRNGKRFAVFPAFLEETRVGQ